MQNKAIVVSGRIVIDDFHERFFLFVAGEAHVTLDEKTLPATSLHETDVAQIRRLFDIGLAGRTIPVGFSSNPDRFSGRIIRLLDDTGGVVSDELQASLGHRGDSSRAVTVSGHVSTVEEMSTHDQLTKPTVTLKKLVTFESIAKLAFEISQSERAGSNIDNWLHAEHELLAQ